MFKNKMIWPQFHFSPNLATAPLFSLVALVADSFHFPFLILQTYGWFLDSLPPDATYKTQTYGQTIDFNFLQAIECVFWISLLTFVFILNIIS